MDPAHRKPTNRLREHREAAGLTQQQLADEVGAGRVTIIRAEQGTQSPTLELADRIADTLDSTIDELFSGSDRETLDDAYRRGRQDAREDLERGQRVDGDTPTTGEDLSDPYGVAAFVAETITAKPSVLGRWQLWRIPDPRGRTRKLDAVVVVQVSRRPPRTAARLFADLKAELSVEDDTRA
jgi:putative transcriptional regulator